jgi:cytochrome c oxidase subunit III
MSVFSPPVAVEKPKSGQGGGVHPPGFGGGDDNGPGDSSPDYGRRLYRARLALVLALFSISMIFVILTVVFVFLHHGAFVFDSRAGAYIREWVQVSLPVRLLLLNTLVLLVSSFTIEMSRRSIAREMALAPVRDMPGIRWDEGLRVPWLAITITLGLTFLVGQWMAWKILQAHGFHISTRKPTPFFYILTGAHAVHLAGGIIALFYAGFASLFRRSIEHRRIVVEVASWYWHFMGILWMYVFALLEFAM